METVGWDSDDEDLNYTKGALIPAEREVHGREYRSRSCAGGMELDTDGANPEEDVEMKTEEQESVEVSKAILDQKFYVDSRHFGSKVAGNLCPESRLYLLLDTNIMLHFLPWVQQFQEYLQGTRRENVQIVVPYTVVKELDALKIQRDAVGKFSEAAVNARKATTWLLGVFKKQGFGVVGQKLEISAQMKEFAESNDDKILKCALELSKGYENNGQSSFVCLVTNDKNLAVKAMFNGILSVNEDEIRQVNGDIEFLIKTRLAT